MAHTSPFPDPGPDEDDVYQIWCLCYAQARSRRVSDNFMHRDPHDGPMPIDFNIWIVRNRHRTILVDSGFSARHAAERNRPLDFDPLDALARLGIDPGEAENVILTHLHYDHAGNIDRFAKATFHVQDAEVAFATGRCMCEPLLRWAFDVEDVVALVRHTYAERVRFHDGEGHPFPGISLHVLPGHSRGMQAVRVRTPRGPVVLASDVSHFYANLLRRSPFSLTVDVAETLRSYEKLMQLAGTVDRVIPGHDPKVRSLYPSQTIGRIKLSALHEEPDPIGINGLARLDDFDVGAEAMAPAADPE